MNTKRILAIVLTIVLALSLAACGSGDSGGNNITPTNTPSENGSSVPPESTAGSTDTPDTSGEREKDITADFTDPVFRSFVREFVGKGESEPILESDVSDVLTLNVEKKGISSLDGIEWFVSLRTLGAGDNQLTRLDISRNTELTSLGCHKNQLTELDVSKNAALTYLTCGSNQLTELDISKNVVLSTLLCRHNQLTAINVSNNSALEMLDLSDNQLTKQDIIGLDEGRTTVYL